MSEANVAQVGERMFANRHGEANIGEAAKPTSAKIVKTVICLTIKNKSTMYIRQVILLIKGCVYRYLYSFYSSSCDESIQKH